LPVNCGESGRLLLDYVEGSLSRANVLSVEGHVASCDACRRELECLREMSDGLAALSFERAPASLEGRVLGALNAAKAPKPTPRRRYLVPALAVGLAAVLILAFWLLGGQRNSRAEELLAQAESAVSNSTNLHMTCTWYRPENRRLTFIQREIWLTGGKSRWDEDGGASQLAEGGELRSARSGSTNIPAGAQGISRIPSFELMLSGIARIRGSGLSLERQDRLKWAGSTYNALVIKGTDDTGNALRTIFMIEPKTSLPVHGEQQKQVDGRWETEGLIDIDYKAKIDPATFQIPS
jgi:hypothetical protein